MAEIKELTEFADKLEKKVCGEVKPIKNFTAWLENRVNELEEKIYNKKIGK